MIDLETHNEKEIQTFPSPSELWQLKFPDVNDWRDKFNECSFARIRGQYEPRYYQIVATNAVLNAIANGKTLIRVSKEGNLDRVSSLLSRGADVTTKDKYGKTALICASQRGHTEVVKLLIEAGALVNAKDNNGDTALIWASFGGHIEVIKLLIEAGADINVKGSNGSTALSWASKNGYIEIVELLTSAGADVNAKNNRGETALSLANNEGIRKLLINAGGTE